MILVELLILQALHISSAALQSCLHAQQLCSQDSSCSQALSDIYNYCGPVAETCQAPRLKKCHRALHKVHISPPFVERDNDEDCWCYEPLGSIVDCQSFRHLVFHHPCIGRIRDLQHERKFAARNDSTALLTGAAAGQPLRRTTRSPMQHQIRHWKSRLSGDLKESQSHKRIGGVIACTDALELVCKRHVACKELWTIFRQSCYVDDDNTCKMKNRDNCWQSYEGISWTGLGNCTCPNGNSDCHWIRLQTSYNKCIYEIAQSGDYDQSKTTIPVGFFNPYGLGITSAFDKMGPGTQWTDEPTLPPTFSTSKTSTTSTKTTTTTTTTPTTTTTTSTTETIPTTRREPRPTVPYTRPTDTPTDYTSYRTRYDTWSSPTTQPSFRSHSEIPNEAKIWTPSSLTVRLVPHMVNVVTVPSRPAPPRLQPSMWSSAETLVPALGGLKLRGQPADSTCQQAFDECESDHDCAWQLSYLRLSCNNEQQRCSRDKCASAMQTFVRLDKTRFVEPMMFCRCRPNDQACANLQQTMFPSCLYQTQDAPMSCTDAIRRCESEASCQSYAKTFFQYCPTGTDGRCSIEVMDHCRHAIMSVRGTSLEFPCYCPVSDGECRRLQYTMLPNNPCVEESMIRYYPGRIDQTTQRQQSPQPSTAGRDRQEQEREHERQRQELERDRQRGTYQRPVAEHTHQQQHSRPTAYPQIAITYTEPPMNDPWGLTKSDDRRSPPAQRQPSVSAGHSSSADGSTDINDPWGIMDRGRSTEIADTTNDRRQGGRDRERGRDRNEPTAPAPQRYDQRQPPTPYDDRRTDGGNNQPWSPTTDNRSRQPPATTARTSNANWRYDTTSMTTVPPTRRPYQPQSPTTKQTDDRETQRPYTKTDFRETNVWPAATSDSGDRPPWETTPPPPPSTTTTPYVTYAPPPAGGCQAKDTSGNMLSHFKGYIIRRYQDYSGQCSSWCQCDEEEQLDCHKLPCLPDGDCDAPLTTIGFGDRLYIKDRGACTCQSGNFICDTPDDMPELDPGLYLLVGYSRLEVQWLRQQVPNEILDAAGFISDDDNVVEDIGARLQVALERQMPKDLQCRIMLPASPLVVTQSDDNAIFQVSWFGSEPLGVNDTVIKKPTWHTGELEKVCVDYLQRLVQEFSTGQAMRYQLVLSTVKQMRLLDNLPILRITDAAVPLHPFSIVILVFCSIAVAAMQTLLIT